MSIPEQAVEAAAKVTFEGLFDLDESDKWEDVSATEREPYERQARAALEAAAPHMLAQAFDQGRKSGMRHADRLVAAEKIGRPELPGPLSPNPYKRSTQ